MDVQQYVDVLARRKGVVLLTLLSTLAVVALGMVLMAPIYSASALVRISEVRTGPATYSDVTYSQQLQNTYIQLLQSRPSLETVIQQLNLTTKPEDLQQTIKVEGVAATELIRVTASRGDAKEAADVANALAALATQNLPPSYTAAVAVQAAPPEAPARPQPVLYMTLAAILGLIGGAGLAFLFENLDRTLRTSDEVELAAGAPLLAWIPRSKSRRRPGGSVSLVDGPEGSSAAEAFRFLGANTMAHLSSRPDERRQLPATFLITSPEAGAGKSTVLVNFATTMARAGQRVVAAGTDLLHPDLDVALGVSGKGPQGTALRNPADASTALVDTKIPGVRLLPSGSFPAASGLPPAPWLKELLRSLSAEADVVLLDSPAVLASADAAMLAPLVDGVLIVAARGLTTDEGLALARSQIDAVGGRIVGVVFNRAEARSVHYPRQAHAWSVAEAEIRQTGSASGAVPSARPAGGAAWRAAENGEDRLEKAG